jgi:hypothetical protein
VITGGQQIVNGAQVILDGGAGFDLYTWKNSLGQTVQSSTAQTFPTSTPDTYTVVVTKGTLTCESAQFTVGSQFYNQNLNYIVTNTVTVDNVLTPAAVDILPVAVDSKTQTIQYFDGLGRPAQTVATQASPLGKDIVTPIAYDEYGRENRKYLPFANGTNGWMQGSLLDGDKNYIGAPLTFYTSAAKVAHDTQRQFSETIFEPSPLNRPSKDYGPGSAWAPSPTGSDKYVEHKYLNNQYGTSAWQEKIIAWQINSTSGALERSTSTNTAYVLSGGYYASNQLTIKVTVDESGNAIREYSDKLGHTVLKKVQIVAGSTDLNNESQWASTYYVYDDAGNLSVVLPPEAVKVLLGL